MCLRTRYLPVMHEESFRDRNFVFLIILSRLVLITYSDPVIII